MFSELLKHHLENEIVGQQRAVETTVRGVTLALSGLVPRRGPLAAFLFIGPSGTGKSLLVRQLAHFLHGDESRLVVADCTPPPSGDPWGAFVSQLSPLFLHADGQGMQKWSVLQTAPRSILLIENFELARPGVIQMIGSALENGLLLLPEGHRGSLHECFVFLTSTLCEREILEAGPSAIGFSPAPTEEDRSARARAFQICYESAVRTWGQDLLDRLDDVVVFHPLTDEHLPSILDRLQSRLNRWIGPRGLTCELMPRARSFLIERGARDLRRGARALVRAYRRHVKFPVADLLLSGKFSPGSLILVDRNGEDDHLHFTVSSPEAAGLPESGVRYVPVAWSDKPGGEKPQTARGRVRSTGRAPAGVS